MGSIYAGIATPTEAAAVGAGGALLLALPRLSKGNFKSAMLETARTTSMIFAIVAGVLIFVHFLGFTGMPAVGREHRTDRYKTYCDPGSSSRPLPGARNVS